MQDSPEMLSVLRITRKILPLWEKATDYVEDEGDPIYHNALSRLFRD